MLKLYGSCWDGVNCKNVTGAYVSVKLVWQLLGRGELQGCNSRRTVLWDEVNCKTVTAGLSFETW